MPAKHIVDVVGPVEFFSEIANYLGAKRGAEIVGHAVLWGLLGLKDKQAILRYLQADLKLSQRTAYRVVDDFADFLHYLEEKHGWCGSLGDGVEELRAVATCQN